MTPLEVVIREPKRKLSDAFIRLLSQVIGLFIIAWLVMLIAPLAIPGFEPDYWQSVGIVTLARLVIPHHPIPYLNASEKRHIGK